VKPCCRGTRTILVLLALAGAPTPAYAGSEGTELPFVAGTGARASSLGLAATSLSGTPSLQYFNPSLIAHDERQQFEFYRTTLFDSDSQFHSLSYVYPTLDWGTLGVTVLRLDIGSIEERDEMNNLLSTDLKNSMTRILLGYAMQFHPRLAAGTNLKIDRQEFGDVNGSGIGLDVGLLFNHEFRGLEWLDQLRAGLAVENLIEPSIKLDREDVADPMRLSVGLSADISYREFGFTSALDVIRPRQSAPRIRFGQEITYTSHIAFRLGMDGSTPTFGVGGSYRNLSLDYAYREEELGSNHRISLAFAFGASREAKAQERQARFDATFATRVDKTIRDLESMQMATLTQRADSLFDARLFDDARVQYEMLLLWNPGNSHAAERTTLASHSARVQAAEESITQGEYLDALHQLKQALQLVSDDPTVNELIALCEKRIGEAADRTEMTQHLLTTSIDLYARGDYADARAGFEEVLRLDPSNRIAHEYHQKSVAHLTADIGRRQQRARALAERGDFNGAIHEIRPALAYKLEDQALTRELAWLEAELAESGAATPGASAVPPPATRQAPAPDGLSTTRAEELDRSYERGVELLEAGQFEEASRELMRVWAASPSHRNVAEPLTRAYLFMGMQMYSNDDYSNAITVWEKILTIDPTNVKVRRYLDKSREEAARLSSLR